MGTGIPVPATIPEGSKAFVVCVPDDPFFMGVVMGLLKQATFKYFWDGTDDEKTAVTDRMLEMYYDYQDQGGCMICEQVAECIEFDEGTQAAIAAAIASSTLIQEALNDHFDPTIPGDSASDTYRNQDQMNETVGCDQDAAWGHIRSGLVDRSFQRVRDVLDQIELTTDNQEMLAATLEAMPVFGVTLKAIGASGIISWFNNVRDFLSDAWDAGDTLTKRDKIACDLFCRWQAAGCKLSFEDVSTYFYENASSAFPTWTNAFTDIVALIAALANPTELTGEFVVDALLGAMFGFQSFINDWFGVQIGISTNDLLFGEPSDDWMTACEECPEEWEFVINFETGENVDFISIVRGNYVPGVGLEQVFFQTGNGYQTIEFDWTTPSGSHLTHFEVDADYTAGEIGASGDYTFYLSWSGSSPALGISEPATPSFPVTWDGDQAGGALAALGVAIQAGIHLGTGDPGGTCRLTRIVLHGTGIPPA